MNHLAYVIARFPLLSETFILREILELQQQGWEFDTFSVSRAHSRIRHPETAALEPSVRMRRPLSTATVGSTSRLLRRDPRLYARLFSQTVLGNCLSPEFLAKGLAVLPWAVEIAETMRRQRVRHIHAHYGTHPALVAMLAAKILGISFSFTVHAHDLFVNTTMLAEKVRAARFVVPISDYNRACLQRLAGPLPDSRLPIVRCGIDLEAYPFRSALEGSYAASGNGRILAVGSLQEYKGHDRLIRACALLRDQRPDQVFQCDIVGEGHLRPQLEGLIAALQLQDRVRLLGGQDHQAVRRLMEQASVLVLPSVVSRSGQMEGLPVTLMEAMAVGTPVVATRLSGIPELVRDGDTGLLVPPDDPGAIRDAVLACWSDPAAAADRARRGRTLVEQEHDLRLNVEKLSDLFAAAVLAEPGERSTGDRPATGSGLVG
jgi:colanic acid/amylovoran biosynthesis glycosyltransferase